LLGAVALVLFPIGLVTRVRCGRCTASPLQYLFNLDSVGGLPRLFISGLFAAVAVLGWRAQRRCTDPARPWWRAIAGIGLLLAAAKLVSVHSTAKQWAAVPTLTVGILLASGVIGALAVTGRQRGLTAARPIAVALAGYAVAALGLDAVTSAVTASHGYAGAISSAAATFVEELGEAVTALLVVVAVRWNLPHSRGVVPAPGVVQDPGSGHSVPRAGDQEVRQQ
jgi:hypothetical protein